MPLNLNNIENREKEIFFTFSGFPIFLIEINQNRGFVIKSYLLYKGDKTIIIYAENVGEHSHVLKL